MSSRQICLKMFIDQGLIIKHPTILKWSGRSVQYVKMFTDDILCCLEYGSAWGIDETVIDIRGKWHRADANLLSEMRTIEQKRGGGGCATCARDARKATSSKIPTPSGNGFQKSATSWTMSYLA
jgi:hypothetical protein